MPLTPLQYRILELSYKHKLSHIGSCLGVIDKLDEIYIRRREDEPVILSCGHAGLALYVVLEKHLGKNAERLFLKHGVHPNKNLEDGIYCSTGSLGMGLSIAVGRALANRNKRVWCMISDGEMAEGVVYEALNFVYQERLLNLQILCHVNGYGAYREIDLIESRHVLEVLAPDAYIFGRHMLHLDIPFLSGQDAHYYVMNENDWKWVEANK